MGSPPPRTPRRWSPRLSVALAALACALPTLVYAASGPGFILDDWLFAAGVHFRWAEAFARNPGRPLGGAWYAVQFFLLGPSPVRQILFLAALNGLVGALLWVFARRILPRHLAALAVAVWAVLPNRASTRLWATTAPNVAALAITVAVALLTLFGRPSMRRHIVGVLLLATSALLYEGALGLAIVVAVLSAWRLPGRGRWAGLGWALGGLGAALAWSALESPKTAEASLLRTAGRLVNAHAGVGIVPEAISVVALVIVVGAVTWALATMVLPSFATGIEERMILVGVVLLGAGAAPFVGPSFPLGTDGLNDRGNLYADVGTAVLLAGALGLVWRAPIRRVGPVVAVVACAVLASGQPQDHGSYRQAKRDGDRLLAAIDALPRELRTKGPLRIAPLPNRGGVSEFYADFDIAAALARRYDVEPPGPDVRIVESPTTPGLWRLVGRRLIPPSEPQDRRSAE